MNQKQSNNDPIQVQKIFQETDLLLQMSQLFKVFGDVTRLKIITLLYEKDEMTVEEIVTCMEMEQSAIWHQLRKLKINHIVKSRKVGKYVLYSLDDSHVLSVYRMALEPSKENLKKVKWKYFTTNHIYDKLSKVDGRLSI